MSMTQYQRKAVSGKDRIGKHTAGKTLQTFPLLPADVDLCHSRHVIVDNFFSSVNALIYVCGGK